MTRIQISLCGLLALLTCCAQGQQINTVEVGTTRYYISDFSPYSSRYNWFLAFQYCNTIGMELLSMPKHEESIELLQFLFDNGKSQTDYWTSGNQLGSPMWTWMSSGQQLNSTFSYWNAHGPPLTKGSNSCMNLQNSQWSASDCMEEKSFICQLTRCYFFNYAVTTRQGNTKLGQATSKGLTKTEKPTFTETENLQKINPSVSASKSIGQSRQNVQNSHNLKTSHQKIPAPLAEGNTANFRLVRPIAHHPLSSHDNKNLDRNNEIESALSLSQELTPPQVVSSPESQATIFRPITDAETIVQKLARKETFSWAFTDDSHNNPK